MLEIEGANGILKLDITQQEIEKLFAKKENKTGDESIEHPKN